MAYKRQTIENKADRLVEDALGHPFFSMRLKPGTEDYETDLEVFRLLFHHEDPDYKVALWNALHVYGHIEELEKESFSEEEIRFIKRKYDTWSNFSNPERINVNAPFNTNRLLLRPTQGESDLKAYWKQLKENGDFTSFTNLKCTKSNIERFGFDMPFFFVIEEKKSHQMIGYVGLRWVANQGRETGVMECEYYIFKSYRREGYAKEALLALCKRAFAGKLYEQVETKYQLIYRNKCAKPQLIRALIREDNFASCSLVENCGFQYGGTMRRYFWVEDKFAANCRVYELEKENVQ